MRIAGLVAGAVVITLCTAVVAIADNSGRIYGKIHTTDGETYEGLIRWDKNEASWVDVLNATKDTERSGRSRATVRKIHGNSTTKYRIFGIDVVGEEGATYLVGGGSSIGIRFGHIKTLEAIDDERGLLVLKSGEELEVTSGSTDIGSAVREIIIEDVAEGEIEFTWDDIERVEFMGATSDAPSALGERLYGTLTTRRGDTYTGYACWDVDELLTSDILDGEEGRRTKKIKFDKIASIERYSSSAALVKLVAGDEVVLRNSNDVDNSNRGIAIADPNLGQVTVQWDEFEKLTFSPAPKQVKYADFDGGRPLQGTVYTEAGDKYTGRIIWDDDEEYTWEMLNGDDRDVEFAIEFGQIKQIQKDSYRSATVTLWDGREFRLQGSNDVDEDNSGISIEQTGGKDEYVDWDEFDRVEFTKP
jgi:hypothetical protein